MTPFMWRVQELLDGDPAPAPATEPSTAVSLARGADAQMMLRSLVEQLVSEANAVLRDSGTVLDLQDTVGPGGLGFLLSYRGRQAAVSTTMHGRTALAQVLAPGTPTAAVQLANEREVESLLLTLLAEPA